MHIRRAVRFALLPIALSASMGVHAANAPATPITNVIVLFQENVSFDHYFGTYPKALNNSGETQFSAYPGTPSVNGLSPALLINNPNKASAPTNQTTTFGAQANPPRLTPAQAFTCSVNHSYGPEQQAVDSGLMDKFPQFTGRVSSVGCTNDGTTVLGYFDGNTVTAYWNYAQNFALNDNSFGSNFGPSTPGALNLIAGQTAGGTTHFGSGSTNSYPNTVTTPVTDIGDFDAYLDDCGVDQGGKIQTATTLEMNSDATAATGNRNIGDLLNAAGVTWGWFQGGFAPTVAATATSPAVCGAARIGHQYPSSNTSTNPAFSVPEPAAPFITQATTTHTNGADYVSHHAPFMFYASTRNPHHLPPTSIAAIGTTDQANHQYDTINFFQALNAGNLPAVSFIKAPSAYNGHPGNSDPVTEQYWVTQTINAIMQSSYWQNGGVAIVIAYDDSDGWYDHVTGPIVSPSAISNTSPGLSGSVGANVYDNFAGVGNCGTPLSGAQPARCGYGPRLPMLVISPYSVSNYVDHSLTNQSSVIRFVEDNWNLGRIDATSPANGVGSYDRQSNSIASMMNFNNPPNTAPLLLACNGDYAASPSAACQVDPNP
jgi:phospholipase C